MVTRQKNYECEVSLGSIVQGQPQLYRDPISKTNHLQQLTHSSLQNHIYSFHVLFECPEQNTDKHQPTGGTSYRFRKVSHLKISYSRDNKNCNVFMDFRLMDELADFVLYCKSAKRIKIKSQGKNGTQWQSTGFDYQHYNKQTNKQLKCTNLWDLCNMYLMQGFLSLQITATVLAKTTVAKPLLLYLLIVHSHEYQCKHFQW